MKRFILLFLAIVAMHNLWATTYIFTITSSDFNNTSYAANNGEHTSVARNPLNSSDSLSIMWYSNQVMNMNGVIQFQKNSGYIYNITSLSYIKEVKVNSTNGTFTTYYGSEQHPTETISENPSFFTVQNGSTAGIVTSIVVTIETQGGNNNGDDEKPEETANNVITYTASEKLEEVTDSWDDGLHTNAFNASITSHTFSNGTGAIIFDGNVTSIGNYAFRGCYGLTSITIPNSVTSIGWSAFVDCSGLTSITIPNSVTSIEWGAFIKCSGLTSITIPNSVTSIGEYAFEWCSGLTSITIPNSVTSIGERAFSRCDNLKTVYNLSDLDIVAGSETHGYVAYYADNVYKSKSCHISVSPSDIQQGTTKVMIDGDMIPNDTILSPYTTITLSANANNHYHFSHWNDGNTDNPRTVTVTENATYTAYFELNTYSLSLSGAANGSVTGKKTGSYQERISITANPDYGYHFAKWSDGNTNNPRTFVLTQDTAFVAEFERNSYSVSVTSSDMTKGTVSGSTTVLYHEQTTISATQNYGYHFTQWNDGNTDNPRTVTVTENATYTAYFSPNTYSLSLSGAANGSVTGKNTGSYQERISITANPDYGYHFAKWSDGNTNNPRTFVLTQDTAFVAEFGRNSYSVSVSSSDMTKGTVSGSTTVLYHEQTAISATPNYGYHFTQWNDGNTDNPRTVTVTENATYTANFSPNTYSLSLSGAANGSVTGKKTGSYQERISITANPDYGYHFAKWSDGNTNNPRTFVLTQDTAFVAEFERNSYSVSVSSSDITKGTVSGSTSALYQEQVTITAVPATGFQFNGWSDGNTENPRVVTLTKDISFVATFGTKMCTLVLIPNDEDAAILRGAGTYEYGTVVECSADVMSEYKFLKWSNGKISNPYRFIIRDDMTLYAFFEEDGGEPIAPSEMIVTPADDNANLQWPQVDNAFSYTMTITKGGETICSLTFNGLGQLINIDFSAAPARAAASAKVASATTGFNFTVTGLAPGTTYGYLIEAKDEKGEVISTEEGTFTTTGEITAIEETTVNKYVNTATKVLRDGQLFILREGKTYNMQGAVVE